MEVNDIFQSAEEQYHKYLLSAMFSEWVLGTRSISIDPFDMMSFEEEEEQMRLERQSAVATPLPMTPPSVNGTASEGGSSTSGDGSYASPGKKINF